MTANPLVNGVNEYQMKSFGAYSRQKLNIAMQGVNVETEEKITRVYPVGDLVLPISPAGPNSTITGGFQGIAGAAGIGGGIAGFGLAGTNGVPVPVPVESSTLSQPNSAPACSQAASIFSLSTTLAACNTRQAGASGCSGGGNKLFALRVG